MEKKIILDFLDDIINEYPIIKDWILNNTKSIIYKDGLVILYLYQKYTTTILINFSLIGKNKNFRLRIVEKFENYSVSLYFNNIYLQDVISYNKRIILKFNKKKKYIYIYYSNISHYFQDIIYEIDYNQQNVPEELVEFSPRIKNKITLYYDINIKCFNFISYLSLFKFKIECQIFSIIFEQAEIENFLNLNEINNYVKIIELFNFEYNENNTELLLRILNKISQMFPCYEVINCFGIYKEKNNLIFSGIPNYEKYLN